MSTISEIQEAIARLPASEKPQIGIDTAAASM